MRFSSWLSSWTRRAGWWKNTRRAADRRNSVAQFGLATVRLSAELLEPRLVLDASTPVDDVAAFAKALKSGGVTLYGAAWDATTTAQRQLFGDGSQFLNFVDVTNSNHSFNSIATNIAKHLKTEHTNIQVSAHELRDGIPLLAQMFDEPFADSSQLPTYLISRAARQHVTVALSGDGGDELFAGYNRHRMMDHVWPALQKIPAPLRTTAALMIRMFSTKQLDVVGKFAKPILPNALRTSQFGDHLHKLASLAKCKEWTDAYVALVSAWNDPAKLVIDSRPETTRVDPIQQANMPDALRAMQWIDQTTYLVDDILTKVDRASMAASLETRVPLLDHRLMEFAWTLPADMKVRNGQGKWILRQALNTFVPALLMDRPKMGFGIPLESWLRGPLQDWAGEAL